MVPVKNSTSEAEYTDRENSEMSTNSEKGRNSASKAEYAFRVNSEMSTNLRIPSTIVQPKDNCLRQQGCAVR